MRPAPAQAEALWPPAPRRPPPWRGTVPLQEMVYTPLRCVFSQTTATFSHCPCSLKNGGGVAVESLCEAA